MAFQEKDSNLAASQLFGIAESKNLNGAGPGQLTLIWRSELDDDGDAKFSGAKIK